MQRILVNVENQDPETKLITIRRHGILLQQLQSYEEIDINLTRLYFMDGGELDVKGTFDEIDDLVLKTI